MADQEKPQETPAAQGSVQNMMPKPQGATTQNPPQVQDQTPPRNDAVELGGSEPTAAAAANADQRQSRGEPLANANARVGMEQDVRRQREVLAGAEHSPHLAIRNRLHANEQENFHYHWFGDDGMRIEYALSLGYEFADAKGGSSDEDKAARSRGLIRMRVPEQSYRQRKDRINRVVNPRAERAARENFIQTGQALDPDTAPMDNTRSRRAPFTQEVRRHDATGMFQDREKL